MGEFIRKMNTADQLARSVKLGGVPFSVAWEMLLDLGFYDVDVAPDMTISAALNGVAYKLGEVK